MKALLLVILMVGTASAKSMSRYDFWTCNFPLPTSHGPITGQAVNIRYDIMAGKGTAVLYPVCRVCAVQPLEIPVVKGGNFEYITYSNNVRAFQLRIFTTTVPMPGAPHMAEYGKLRGSCYPKIK